jgi:DNA polymerase-3 subunit alpha
MGKKDKAKMAVEREKFKEGAAKLHGIAPELADQIFDLLEKFAGYGFNRSHSAAYAWISYQTAFLKANYPVEFMAAVLSNEVSNTDKIAIFVAECERMGIQILPPDINLSGLNFAPERLPEEQGTAENLHSDARVGVIRYGLAAIKNVGEGAMVELIREREENGSFRSLEDLCARVDGRKLNKKVLESLVKCGALDFLKVERALLDADIDSALASAATAHRDRAAGQFSLFDLGTEAPETKPRSGTRKMAEAANVQPWSQAEKLAFEKELLGFYVTGHPLDEYRTALRANGVVEIARLGEQEAKSTVTIAGALQTVEQKYTKNGNKPFAVVTIEDLTGTLEVMVWSEAYTRSRALLVAGNVVSITGRLDLREEGPRIAADTVKPLQKVSRRETPVLIRMERSRMSEEAFVTIQRILMNHPGNRPVHLELETSTGQKVVLVPSERYRVAWSPTLEGALAPWMN